MSFNTLQLLLILAVTLDLCQAQQQPQNLTSFSDFFHGVNKASYKDYSSSGIENEKAFVDIKAHILSMYGGVKSPASIASFYSNGGHTDCLPYAEQSTIHLLSN